MIHQRPRFKLMLLVVLLGAFAVLCPQGTAVGTGASAMPDHITLTWSVDPCTSQTITWRTDTTIKSGMVRYQQDSPEQIPMRTITVAPRLFESDLGPQHLFSGVLTGLLPGARYRYQVGDKGHWSAWHSFCCAAKKTSDFTFLIFGDSQSGDADDLNYAPWAATVQQAFTRQPQAKFIINMGDLVEMGQQYRHWNQWFAAAKGVIDTIPEMAVQGNHETFGATYSNRGKPAYWIAQLPLPQNGPAGLQNQVYSYDYGDAHFVVLDSQKNEEAPNDDHFLASQKKWLAEDLAQCKKTWKFAFFHKTPYYNQPARTNPVIKDAFCPILEQYHVDVVFNAHDHGVARTFLMNHDEFMAKPSQGTLYYVVGRSGNKAYSNLATKVWDAFLYDPQDQPNYIAVRIHGQTLNIRAIKQDGELIDNYTIDRSHDSDNPKSAIPNCSWEKYARPTLVIYGSVISPLLAKHDPIAIHDKWYIDLNAFVTSLGGSVNGNIVTLNNTTYTLTEEQLVTDKAIRLINTDGLQTMGFSARFSAASNILLVTK